MGQSVKIPQKNAYWRCLLLCLNVIHVLRNGTILAPSKGIILVPKNEKAAAGGPQDHYQLKRREIQ
jgi:hypothetical protein